MAGTLFSQPYAPFLALGVGELGGRAAAAGALEGFGEKAPWSACDSQASRLLSTGLERKLLIELPDQARPDVANELVAAKKADLRALASRRTVALLFGALGGTSSALLLPALSAALREQGLFVCVIGVEPFELEGAARSAAASRCAALLPGAADLFLQMPSAPLLAPLGPTASLSQAYRAAESALSGAVEALLGAFVGTSAAPAFTASRLSNALRGTGAASAAIGFGSGLDAPRAALEAALAEHWQAAGMGTGEGGLATALVAGREIALAEAQLITKRLQEGRPAGAAALLGLGLDSSLGDEARCLILRRAGPSRNVISLNSATTTHKGR
jgi:cell division GTPase FtsZ